MARRIVRVHKKGPQDAKELLEFMNYRAERRLGSTSGPIVKSGTDYEEWTWPNGDSIRHEYVWKYAWLKDDPLVIEWSRTRKEVSTDWLK